MIISSHEKYFYIFVIMGWRGVHEAVAVADTGSFTAAADKLNTTVANVSRRISDLEDRLGVKLFTRTTRQVSLNPNGENYILQCREALSLLEQAKQEITTQQTALKGQIRMTAAIEFGERVIAPKVAAFQTLNTEVSIQLELSNNRYDLLEGKYDFAIRIGELSVSSLIAHKVAERRLVTCAAPQYLKRCGSPKKPADLKQHSCLRGSARQWRFMKNGKSINQNINSRFQCNSGTAITAMAIEGLGIAQLPAYYVASHIDDKKLQLILAEFEPKPEGIWIVRPDNRYIPDRVRQLINFLTAEIKP